MKVKNFLIQSHQKKRSLSLTLGDSMTIKEEQNPFVISIFTFPRTNRKTVFCNIFFILTTNLRLKYKLAFYKKISLFFFKQKKGHFQKNILPSQTKEPKLLHFFSEATFIEYQMQEKQICMHEFILHWLLFHRKYNPNVFYGYRHYKLNEKLFLGYNFNYCI